MAQLFLSGGWVKRFAGVRLTLAMHTIYILGLGSLVKIHDRRRSSLLAAECTKLLNIIDVIVRRKDIYTSLKRVRLLAAIHILTIAFAGPPFYINLWGDIRSVYTCDGCYIYKSSGFQPGHKTMVSTPPEPDSSQSTFGRDVQNIVH